MSSAQSGAIATGLSIRQSGKVVSFDGYITGLTLGGTTTIGRVFGVSLPTTNIRTYCNVGTNAYSMGTPSYIMLDPATGDITITTSNTGTGRAIYFSFAYIV